MQIWNSSSLLIYCAVLAFSLGTVFGSFLNCIAGRITIGEKWWKGKSKCDGCGHELCALDLLPVISYVFQKGRCRYCGMKLSIQYPISEALLGCLFVIYVLAHGTLDTNMIFDLGLICILYGLSICDCKTYEIPNGFIGFGIFWWILFEMIDRTQGIHILWNILYAFSISGSVLLLSLCMDKILKKETMGGGDIKLLFLVGLRLGLFASIINLMLSCVIGIIVITIIKTEKIPFGPAISFATYTMLVMEKTVLAFYINLF